MCLRLWRLPFAVGLLPFAVCCCLSCCILRLPVMSLLPFFISLRGLLRLPFAFAVAFAVEFVFAIGFVFAVDVACAVAVAFAFCILPSAFCL